MKQALGILVCLVAIVTAAPSVAQTERANTRRHELAKEYVIVTNRLALTMRTYEKQLRSASTFCDGKPCKADFESAISDTLNEVGPKYQAKIIEIYASHLTEAQLTAAIQFAESPVGRSITESESGMTSDVASAGNEMWKEVNEGVSRRFCAAQKELCHLPDAPSKSAPKESARSNP